jgi:hypothetical protein
VTVFDANEYLEKGEQIHARLTDKRINLPLDDFIRTLGRRNRQPLLRNFAGGELEYARLAIKSAVASANANFAARRLSELTTKDLGVLSKLVSKLMTDVVPQLEEAGKLIRRMGHVQQYYQDLEFEPFRDLHDTLVRLALKIREVEPTSRRLYAERRQNVGDVWKIAFVGALFRPWRELTGGNPQPDGPFLEFVEAAWCSLSPNQPYVPFERAIRTAKAKWRDSAGPEVSGPPPKR